MRNWFAACALVFCLSSLAGCQCCFLTEPYACAIDQVSSHECGLDWLYHPALDLTRIGRRDWCQCGLNRMFCRCRCDRVRPVACATDYELREYRTISRPAEPPPEPEPLPMEAEPMEDTAPPMPPLEGPADPHPTPMP